jgi:phosphomevalonate kinase
MPARHASAPGKVLLCGEYAILEGHCAVVMAVDRRVHARLAPSPQSLSPFLDAVRKELALRAGDSAERAARIIVDSRALQQQGHKLGLGSSAAATVAAAALALGDVKDPRQVHEIAHLAHAAAQARRGARGSGADVAASVHGGIVRVEKQGDERAPLSVQALPTPDLELLLVWTGSPADTPSLVARVQAHKGRDPKGHEALLANVGAAAIAVAQALVLHDGPSFLAGLEAGARALDELANHTKAPLIPAVFPAVASFARDLGGVAKPTGAGGGDLILCAFAGKTAAEAFSALAHRQGMILVSAHVDPRGVELAAEP